MKKTALVIMAAGLGSRFGKGIKQLAKVGPQGEIIMEYSIHDALEAGFNKVVFPHPLCPSIDTNSLSLNSIFTPFNACTTLSADL